MNYVRLSISIHGLHQHLRLKNWNGETVPQWLEKWAKEKPAAIAAIDNDREITFKQIYEDALCLANSLLGLGIRKGRNRDTITQPDRVHDRLFRSQHDGECSTMHIPYRAGEMEPLLKHASARAIICVDSNNNYDAPAELVKLRKKVDTLEHVIVVGKSLTTGTLSLTALIDQGKQDRIDNPPVASDPAILCFTSGTSSAPKAVVHSYQTMLANNRVAAPIYNMSDDDIVLCGSPFTHAFGICVLNFTLMVGAKALLMPAFNPASLIRISNKPTIIFVAPAHIAACLKSGSLEAGIFRRYVWRRYPGLFVHQR